MKRAFLLGAGFTHDISDKQFPLQEELVKQIIPHLDKDLVETYRFETDAIETALTRLDLDYLNEPLKALSPENRDQVLKHKKRLQETKEKIIAKLADVFSMQGKELRRTKTTEVFVNGILSADDIVLTTNYDSYLENLLGQDKWSFHGGYGKRICWRFTERNENSQKMNIKIFKLHGSPSFLIVPGDLEDRGDVELAIYKKEFPSFHSELGWLEDAGPYLIAPSFIKPMEYDAMSLLYQEAIEEIKGADQLIVIGSNLREEDYMLWFILSHLDRIKTKIVLIDLNTDPLIRKLKNILRFSQENIKGLNGTLTDKVEDLKNILNQELI